MDKKKLIAIILSIVFLVIVISEFIAVLPYYKMSKVEYLDLDGNEISARYYKGERKEGIVLVNDLSHDMSNVSIMASEFIKMGYSVFTFDFPSQGDTKGYIKYGYRKTTELAELYYCGIDNFAKMSGISGDNMHVIAKGTGARIALQVSSLGFFTPKDLILIETDTNLENRIQFDVINYNKDSDLLWLNSMNEKQPNDIDITLISNNLGESGRRENDLLEKQLSSKNKDSYYFSTPSNNTTIKDINWVLPGYEFRNGRVISYVANYIASKDGINYSFNLMTYLNTLLSLAMLGIVLAVLHITGDYMDEKYHLNKNPTRYLTREIFISKLLALFPSLLLVFILPVVLYFTVGSIWPFPYLEVMKVSIISCCGIVLYVLYNKTAFAQDLGEVIFVSEHKKNIKGGIIVLFASVVIMYLLALGGLKFILTNMSLKVLWVVLFGFLSSFIYFIDEKEKEVMDLSRLQMLLITAMNFGSIAVVSVFLLFLGKIALAIRFFLITAIIVFTLEIGRILRAIETPTMFSAFIKSLILYAAILSQSILFF